MTRKVIGRPTKITTGVVSKLEDAIRHGATVGEACYLSGISRETFYHHFRSDKEFSDKMELSRTWLRVIAKHNLASAVINGDMKASLWLLEKHDSLPINDVNEEVPKVSDNKASLETFERLVNYRIEAYRDRLEAKYDLVPKTQK
jgi:AcrR family transcriptional regulator